MLAWPVYQTECAYADIHDDLQIPTQLQEYNAGKHSCTELA